LRKYLEDKIGYVELVDFMGSDLDVVRAARVSYNKELTNKEKDLELLNFLIKEGHTSTTEHCVFKFKIKCPIFVARQVLRHRVSSTNELSGRYSEFEPEFYIPTKLRYQVAKHEISTINLRGVNEEQLIEDLSNFMKSAYRHYQYLLTQGIAKEIARIVLPVSTYTTFIWTINTRSLINFLKLRTSEHTQKETRDYAGLIEGFFKNKMPETHKAYVKYIA